MKRILSLSCIAALAAASSIVIAQPTGYAGPSSKAQASGYAGPTNVPLMSARELLDKGKDDQYVRLKGRIVNHKGGEDYEFADQSGRLTVEIDDKHFPAGVRIDQNTLVELVGEFDKELVGESKFEVKQIKPVAN